VEGVIWVSSRWRSKRNGKEVVDGRPGGGGGRQQQKEEANERTLNSEDTRLITISRARLEAKGEENGQSAGLEVQPRRTETATTTREFDDTCVRRTPRLREEEVGKLHGAGNLSINCETKRLSNREEHQKGRTTSRGNVQGRTVPISTGEKGKKDMCEAL